MELKLVNGQYVPARHQGFARVEGLEELAQRIVMKLTARRGRFMPLPSYGSRLYLLPTLKPSQRETAAWQYVVEALADESCVRLEQLEFNSEGNLGNMTLNFVYNDDTKLTIKAKA